MIALGSVLEAVAITIVFVRGSIFKSFRESGPALWRELASCPLCAGVWIGAGWMMAREAVAGRIRSYPPVDFMMTALGTGAVVGSLALLFVLTLAVLDKHS